MRALILRPAYFIHTGCTAESGSDEANPRRFFSFRLVERVHVWSVRGIRRGPVAWAKTHNYRATNIWIFGAITPVDFTQRDCKQEKRLRNLTSRTYETAVLPNARGRSPEEFELFVFFLQNKR